MLLNKQQIFAADDLKTAVVEMPEWGGAVKIKVMSVGDQLRFDEHKEDGQKSIFYTIVKSCIDENGDYLFNDEDVINLEKKNSVAIIRLFNEIMKLNKQKEDDQEALAKNC